MLRTLIVDDEAPARQRLRRLLDPFVEGGRLDVRGEATDGVEALDLLREEPVDLLFLDVKMPELGGFDVLDRLPPLNRPSVVFTTAYDQYALRAFEANAVDYLLKPIESDRLEEAVRRVEARRAGDGAGRQAMQERLAELLEYLDQQSFSDGAAPPRPDGVARVEYLRQLSVPGKDRLIVVNVDDLLAAEVQEGITRLFVLAQAPGTAPSVARHLVSYTLDALEHRLDPEAFMRVHRSSIVQLSHIREMISWFSGRYKLVLTGGHEVVASRARSKELKDRLSL
ncbi:MAG: LytTR family DNA-binding domain-containing protein [Rubricoccaceae bacterium]|nr:LytTR family DNA-binding domain-containing protein [Rubricoccaceae bacterium]